MADMFNALMQGRQAGQQNRLAQLASQSYGAPQESQQSLLSQMAAIDPRAAQAQQGQFQQDEDRTGQQLRGYVEYVNKARASNNPMAVNAALRAGAPLIQRLTGKAPPTEWTPDMDAGWAELEAKVAMSPAGAGGAGVQSTYVDGEGNRVAIMRDGSTTILGKNDAGATQQTITINGPDGRPAQFTFDRRTGNYVPAGQSMGAPQQPAQQQAPATTQFTGPDGMPVQIGNDIPEHVRQQILANPQAFQEVPDGTQAQLPDRPVQQFSGGGQVAQAPQPGSPFVGRRPEDEAAAIAAARRGVDNSMPALPSGYRYTASGGMEAIPGGPADPNVIASGATARRPPSPAEKRDAATRKTKYAQAQNVDRGLDRIDQALRGLSGGIMDTGPIDQYAQRFTKAGQEMEAAVGGMQNSLLALTRVPGIGSQSDLEARIAMLQYPSLDKAPEVNARTLANLRLFVQDLKAAYDTAVAEDENLLTAPVNAPTQQGSDIDSLLDMYR